MLRIRNGQAAPLADVPALPFEVFRDRVIAEVEGGARVSAFFGHSDFDRAMHDDPIGERIRLVAVITEPGPGTLALLSTHVAGAYPAITPICPQLHWFERELAESRGVEPLGHPWLEPIRYLPGRDSSPVATEFFRVEGAEIHEVAVGPVHAGVIEPGHFRFQCHGEDVLHLEIALGYQHRGVERAMVEGPAKRRVHYAETLAGDTTVGHATAYALAVEALGQAPPPARAEAIRATALELERLANHVGDLGALANDVGFLPVASYCGRLRGDYLNLTAQICGSRFGRGLVRPGGVAFELEPARAHEVRRGLHGAARDTLGAIDLLFGTPSAMTRFQGTGRLWRSQSQMLGLVGVAARATGVARDVRFEFPTGLWRGWQVPPATWHSGDVFARALVRRLEIERSLEFLDRLLADLPDGPVRSAAGPAALAPSHIAVALVEGWRGEICHVGCTDAAGNFGAYKVVDPSFHNWMGLALALRDGQISDFPLCNKSFNLSYCGHDL